jgi:glucosamine 6-phosphate synthetase-like amidotransferase/phosphosugar isomerase protein
LLVLCLEKQGKSKHHRGKESPMCGIVGFTGEQEAAPLLLEALSRLEYRGYDSAGLAVRNEGCPIEVVKAKGRLKILSDMTNGGQTLKGHCGIGHTRCRVEHYSDMRIEK